MNNRSNKVLITILMVLSIIAILGGIFVYAYVNTDIFRTEQELFAKYLIQNMAEIDETLNFIGIDEIEEQLSQSKYEDRINISYTEPGEEKASVQMAIESQNDPINKKYYGVMGVLTEDLDKILKIEYMKENEEYSLRFTNAVKEFLTVRNSNLKQFAQNLGVDEETINKIPDTIDFEKFSLEKIKFSDEEINTERTKYLSLIYNSINKEKYTKSKDTVITLNGKTITTNAYILTLDEQDIKNLTIQLLITLKQDEIILNKLQILDEMAKDYTQESIKTNFEEAIQSEIDNLNTQETIQEKNIIITLYEQSKNVVRLKVEQELESYTVDTIESEGRKQIELNYTNIDEANTQYTTKLTFTKENDNKLKILNTIIDGEEQKSNELNIELFKNDNNVKLDITFINDEVGRIWINRNIDFVNEINYKVVLDKSNNIILNELKAEQIIKIFSQLGPKLTTEYLETLGLVNNMENDFQELEIQNY